MNRYSNPFRRRDRDTIREFARDVIDQHLEDPAFEGLNDDDARRAYLRTRVRERVTSSGRYGNVLVTWLMSWAVNKLIELAITIWLNRRKNPERKIL